MLSKVFRINGMACHHCKVTIENWLKEIGVKSNVDLPEKTVTVQFNPIRNSINEIINVIESAGYVVVVFPH